MGGMAQHYGGVMGRYGPWVYQIYSDTVSKYGLGFLNAAVPHQDIIDWPMTYDEYMPYYEQWEKMWGVCGTNEGPLLSGFLTQLQLSTASCTITPVGTAFKNATEALGYSPFPGHTLLPLKVLSIHMESESKDACMTDGALDPAIIPAKQEQKQILTSEQFPRQ